LAKVATHLFSEVTHITEGGLKLAWKRKGKEEQMDEGNGDGKGCEME